MKNGLIIGILVVIATVTIYWDTNTITRNFYDDSYIAMRCAINLAEHGVLSFNVGEYVDCVSAFLFTVILAAIYKLGFHDLEMVAGIINLVSLFLVAFYTYLSIVKLTNKIWLAYFMSIVASLHGLVSGWAITGMDTTLYTALLVAFTYYTLINKKHMISELLLCILIIARPEGLLMFPIWLWVNRKNMRDAYIPLVTTVILYGFKMFYYGSFVPNSMTAKLSHIYYASDWEYVLHMWIIIAIVPVVFSVWTLFTSKKPIRLLWLFILLSVIPTFIIKADYLRYTSHLIPLFIIVGACSFPRKRWLIIPYLLLMVLMAYQTFNSILWIHSKIQPIASCQILRLQTGEYLNKNIEKGQWIISNDVGAIGYKAMDFCFIDDVKLLSHTKVEQVKPMYIADTFQIYENQVYYNRPKLSEYFKDKDMNVLWMGKYTDRLSIGVVKLQGINGDQP